MLKPITIERKTYTVDEVTIMLGVTKKIVYKLIKEKRFVAYKFGKEYRISKDSFDNWFSGIE